MPQTSRRMEMWPSQFNAEKWRSVNYRDCTELQLTLSETEWLWTDLWTGLPKIKSPICSDVYELGLIV